jgi:hypothetical protein
MRGNLLLTWTTVNEIVYYNSIAATLLLFLCRP